jgi:hypothetical protein
MTGDTTVTYTLPSKSRTPRTKTLRQSKRKTEDIRILRDITSVWNNESG